MTVLPEIILTGDCRDRMPAHGPYDMILADPPYGDTSLAWDRRVEGWLTLARAALAPTGSMWVFGSLRSFMAIADRFTDAGLRLAQEIVWEKQNGTSFHADRFKRVHEPGRPVLSDRDALARHLQRPADDARRDRAHRAAQAVPAPYRPDRRRPLCQPGRRATPHALGHLPAQLPRPRHPPDREAIRASRNPHPHEPARPVVLSAIGSRAPARLAKPAGSPAVAISAARSTRRWPTAPATASPPSCHSMTEARHDGQHGQARLRHAPGRSR